MKHILLVLFLIIFASPAKALILIEPYAGYNFGNTLIKFTDGTKEETSTKGGTFGGRLGIDILYLFVALDGSVSTGSGDVSNSATDYDVNQKTFGITAGVTIPLMATRIWAGYSPLNLLYFKNTTDSTTDSMRGSQLKGGIGFRIIPYLHINGEYRLDKFDEYNGKAFGANNVKSIDSHSIVIYLSVPI